MKDNNTPKHYMTEHFKYDVIDLCKIYDLNFNRGNALKYIVRAGKKDPKKEIEDLEKAIVYLNREIIFIKDIKLKNQ